MALTISTSTPIKNDDLTITGRNIVLPWKVALQNWLSASPPMRKPQSLSTWVWDWVVTQLASGETDIRSVFTRLAGTCWLAYEWASLQQSRTARGIVKPEAINKAITNAGLNFPLFSATADDVAAVISLIYVGAMGTRSTIVLGAKEYASIDAHILPIVRAAARQPSTIQEEANAVGELATVQAFLTFMTRLPEMAGSLPVITQTADDDMVWNARMQGVASLALHGLAVSSAGSIARWHYAHSILSQNPLFAAYWDMDAYVVSDPNVDLKMIDDLDLYNVRAAFPFVIRECASHKDQSVDNIVLPSGAFQHIIRTYVAADPTVSMTKWRATKWGHSYATGSYEAVAGLTPALSEKVGTIKPTTWFGVVAPALDLCLRAIMTTAVGNLRTHPVQQLALSIGEAASVAAAKSSDIRANFGLQGTWDEPETLASVGLLPRPVSFTTAAGDMPSLAAAMASGLVPLTQSFGGLIDYNRIVRDRSVYLSELKTAIDSAIGLDPAHPEGVGVQCPITLPLHSHASVEILRCWAHNLPTLAPDSLVLHLTDLVAMGALTQKGLATALGMDPAQLVAHMIMMLDHTPSVSNLRDVASWLSSIGMLVKADKNVGPDGILGELDDWIVSTKKLKSFDTIDAGKMLPKGAVLPYPSHLFGLPVMQLAFGSLQLAKTGGFLQSTKNPLPIRLNKADAGVPILPIQESSSASWWLIPWMFIPPAPCADEENVSWCSSPLGQHLQGYVSSHRHVPDYVRWVKTEAIATLNPSLPSVVGPMFHTRLVSITAFESLASAVAIRAGKLVQGDDRYLPHLIEPVDGVVSQDATTITMQGQQVRSRPNERITKLAGTTSVFFDSVRADDTITW